MSANGGDRFTVEEAAEKLRAIKSSAGEDTLEEFFRTGGGLLGFEEDDLTAAVEVVGRQRAQQILEVEIPSEAPGEQAALGGGPTFPDRPRERAEPTPEDTASLAEFRRRAEEVDQQIADREASERRAEEIREEVEGGFDPNEPITRTNFPLEVGDTITLETGQEAVFVDFPTGGPQFDLPGEEPPFDTAQMEVEEFRELWEGQDDGLECMDRQNAIEAILSSARRQGFLNVNEFDQSVAAAEDAGCVSSADATRLRDTAQSAAPEPSAREFDQLLEDVQTAFAGGQGNR